ncbi:FHA domain-containing protein [Variovorax arabinosiphilus]|uniref:FHA domain-containing protein n=1 Tax=Variovorax arabinosiphilus TaxID=3053498 RepID=UPI002574F065|nr:MULTISPECIES: FHA domain-containing protein [unclassified Variovorax]MDM0120700.1 FHA domain-containing protein [Variovorax sp. J2L1-78]MDM0127388.1 FHA domain-containing protein [Variovorax sp. J2L1-63]MDM0231087.1 FHA domain-containing protein [Variovorax sp. J2R1-6]
MPRLIILSKAGTPRQINLAEGRTTIGRTDRNTLVLDSPLVSRAHAAIDVVGTSVTVTDLRSSNGTLVNGRKIGVHPLKNREVLEIGDVQLRFLSVVEAARDAEPLRLAPRTDFSPFDETAYPRTIFPRR